MFKRLHALFHPEEFQGWGKSKRYFEGWYFKVVNADETKALAFIPGIAMDKNVKQQAFIQVMDGKLRTAEYHKFNANEFQPQKGKFEISIQQNYFSNKLMRLQLPNAVGQLNFYDRIPWPNPFYSPGIMGPYSFVPFMECYHGILSMDHRIEGQLTMNGEAIDFTNGRGYMEKDWGRSFPKAYFWMQTNHFSQPGISLKASVACIPWMGSTFIGFIAGVWLHDHLIQFTTYNGSRLIKSIADHKEVKLIFENRKYRLEIIAYRDKATQLVSPVLGFMDGRIKECMTSLIDVNLYNKKTQNIILLDTGRNAGLEVAGRIETLTYPIFRNSKKDNF